jgi:hypothetical protein
MEHAETHLLAAKMALHNAKRAAEAQLSEMAASYSNSAAMHRRAYAHRLQQARSLEHQHE